MSKKSRSLFSYKDIKQSETAQTEIKKPCLNNKQTDSDELVSLTSHASESTIPGSEPESVISTVEAPNNNQDTSPQESSFDDLEKLLPEDWQTALAGEFKKPYWNKLKQHLIKEASEKKEIYPPIPLIFTAFHACPLDDIKVVIIGQDPYHDTNQATGLAFSIPPTLKKLPPSLGNIYKELTTDIDGFQAPRHGDLSSWASQGVFLLNTVLTVRAHEANSHKKFGWLQFTDAVVKVLSEKKQLVWMLWGKPAEKKAEIVVKKKDNDTFISISVHPSPLSASRGWFGSKHFSKCNEYLVSIGKEPIKWQN